MGKWKGKLAVLFLALICGGVLTGLGAPWLWSEIVVRRVLSIQGGAVCDGDLRAVCKYVSGGWLGRPTWAKISEGRQARLAGLAVEQAVAQGDAAVLMSVTEQWHRKNLFPQLPQYVAKAVADGVPNCELLLGTVGGEKGRIDRFIDVPYVMEQSRSERAITSCCIVLAWETLDRNRSACLRMLGR
jgi:hypothetical protein